MSERWTTEGKGVLMAMLCDGEHVGEYEAVERLNEYEARIAELEGDIEEHQSRDGLQQMRIESLEAEVERLRGLLREAAVIMAEIVAADREAPTEYLADEIADAAIAVRKIDAALTPEEKT